MYIIALKLLCVLCNKFIECLSDDSLTYEIKDEFIYLIIYLFKYAHQLAFNMLCTKNVYKEKKRKYII